MARALIAAALRHAVEQPERSAVRDAGDGERAGGVARAHHGDQRASNLLAPESTTPSPRLGTLSKGTQGGGVHPSPSDVTAL